MRRYSNCLPVFSGFFQHRYASSAASRKSRAKNNTWQIKLEELIKRTKEYIENDRAHKKDANCMTASWLLLELEALRLDPDRARELSQSLDRRLYNPNHNGWLKKDFSVDFDTLEYIFKEAYQLGYTQQNSNNSPK